MKNINKIQLIKDVARLVWNKYLATPKNERKEMQFSYDNLKHEIGSIITDYPALTHPITKQKLWEMAKLITEKQREAKNIPTDKVDWNMLEGEWFDWLEEELFGE